MLRRREPQDYYESKPFIIKNGIPPRMGGIGNGGLKQLFECDQLCQKKNLNASRPSEHPPVRGKAVLNWGATSKK